MMEHDLPLDDVRFVVVDVETTGGSSTDHRIMELGYCVVEDGAVVRRFSSLIDPGQPIPDFIEMMTGISNAMVHGATDESEVLPMLLDELRQDGTVFVGHNVGFDWGFVTASFRRHSDDIPEVQRLCTCRLSRRISTGLEKHNLGAVAGYYDVTIEARHRALGDAEATAHALLKMIERARNDYDAQTLGDLLALQSSPRKSKAKPVSKTHKAVHEKLQELPDEPGVYYFYNTHKSLLYVGKAKSLKHRVSSYFQGLPTNNRRLSKMIRFVRNVMWETTGTELGALLLESREIKNKRPSFNVASREYHPPSFLKITSERFPRIELVNRIDDDGGEYFGPFRSERMAQRIMEMLVREHGLRTCEGDIEPDAEYRPCFSYHIKRCDAPCTGNQTEEDYALALRDARAYLGNVEEGAIGALSRQMEAAAARMDFEHAAMLRDGIREIERVTLSRFDRPLAVSDTNIIIVVPTSDRYATVEVFMLRAGRLVFQRVMGSQASLDVLHDAVQDVYFGIPEVSRPFTDREMDELRLATSWLYQHREKCTTVVVSRLELREVTDLVTRAVRGSRPAVRKAEAGESYEQASEYSQLTSWDVTDGV